MAAPVPPFSQSCTPVFSSDLPYRLKLCESVRQWYSVVERTVQSFVGVASQKPHCHVSERDSHFLLRRHSDCPISPLDTSAFVTAWIPLRPIKARPYTAFCVAASDSTSQPITCQLFAEQGQAQRCNSVVSLALVDDQYALKYKAC